MTARRTSEQRLRSSGRRDARLLAPEVLVALLLVAISILGILLSSRIDVTAVVVDPLGPRRYPQLLFFLLLVLSTAYLINELRRQSASAVEAATESRTESVAEPCDEEVSYARPAIALTAIVAYALVLEHVGYLVATTALLLAIHFVFGIRERWRIAAMASVGMTVFLYAFFAVVLQVPLPAGRIFG